MPAFVVFLAVMFVVAGCTPRPAGSPTPDPRGAFPPAPTLVPDGPLDLSVREALDGFVSALLGGAFDGQALDTVAASEDARLAWFVADLLRFLQGSDEEEKLIAAFARLTGVNPRDHPRFAESSWRTITDQLIVWNLPAPPGYRELKAQVFLSVEPAWAPFFADADSTIDWRIVSWGGVLIDDRPLGDPGPCTRGCIPALDDPALTPAAGGDWYPDEAIIFGVVVGDEVVALPKNIMEVHEMVNITIGGRRLGIPYCTLCASAQAYFTDSVPEGVASPVLRTSGLLSLSNKVMYDLHTSSVFDTFTGVAISGPLREAGIVLDQATVVVTSWGEWKAAHPETRIVAEDGGLGRAYPADPLGGRDDQGPIFPIGAPDPRLPVQALVVGVIAPNGTPVAFPVELARATLAEGRDVVLGDVEVVTDGGGLRVRARGGEELPAHQAFWFAWSQFHPGTALWTPLSR